MGVFINKKNTPDNIRSAAEALRFIKNSPTPLLTLSLILIIIKKDKILSEVELEAIGLDKDEVDLLLSIFANTVDDKDKKDQLYINAHLRLVEREVDKIILENNLFDTESKKRELASRLAKFAIDNKIDNLETAYRLMKSEQISGLE
jgi:hypothetical protein